MEILDTTLREGEQCFGVFFPIEAKKKIASLLDRIGVDFIEVGHPAAAPSIRRAVAGIAELNLWSRLIGHARLDRDEIRLVRDLGLSWVGLFSGINATSLKRYGLSRQDAYRRITDAVLYAKDLGLSIRFTCEDASRTASSELALLYSHLLALGVDRLSYADTVGIETPGRVAQMHTALCRAIPFLSLHYHFHNDDGNAFANAKKAFELGAQCIDASVMGIGERMGIVPLENILAWRSRTEAVGNGAGWLDIMVELQELVSASINVSRFGQRRFAHKSGIHIHGVLRDPAQYEPADPVLSGGQRLIVLSKLIGRSGLRSLLSTCGIEADKGILDRMLERIKSEDFLELVNPQDILRYLEQIRRDIAKTAAPISERTARGRSGNTRSA